MASLTPSPKMQFFDANGNPLAGGKLYTYTAGGTSTPQATYTDYGGGTPNANPVILDSRGEASVWLGSSTYYMVLKDSADVQIWTADNISGQASLASLAASSGSSLIGYIASATGSVATTVQSKLRNELKSVLDAMTEAQKSDITSFTGALDVTTAVRTYLSSISAGGTAIFPDGYFKVTDTLSFGDINIQMSDGAMIKATNSGVVLQCTAQVTSRNYKLNIENAQANATCLDFREGAGRCTFELRLDGGNASGSVGIRLRGESASSPGTARGSFSNTFINPKITGFAKCQWLDGANIADGRCNGNSTIGGVLSPKTLAISVHGEQNSWNGTVINKPNDGAVARVYIGKPTAADDQISIMNSFNNAYFDDTAGASPISVDVKSTIISPIAVIYNCTGLTDLSAVDDINAGGTDSVRVVLNSYGRQFQSGVATFKGGIKSLSAASDMSTSYGLSASGDTTVLYAVGAHSTGAAGAVYMGGNTWAGNNACPANGGLGLVFKAGSSLRISETANHSSFTKRLTWTFADGADTENLLYDEQKLVGIYIGNRATPEGNVTAEKGSMYLSNNAGKLFIKETGSGNTGWVQK